MGNELYIGAPNGIVLCVDGLNEAGIQGCFYHSYSNDPVRFATLGELLFRMEGFFDRINFPHRGNSDRTFTNEPPHYFREKERNKVMSDQELLGHKGQQETFIVRVQHRQNNTWQGRITWAEKNKTLTFRSIWEMVHLMENAIYEDVPAEEIPEYRKWEDEPDR